MIARSRIVALQRALRVRAGAVHVCRAPPAPARGAYPDEDSDLILGWLPGAKCVVARFLTVARDTAHLKLSIDVESDPISGWVERDRYAAVRGWIELVAAIEAARSPSYGSRVRELGKPRVAPRCEGRGAVVSYRIA